ncbi:14299_t:CDS:1, partial [Cetraspora pellucida]
MSSTEDIKNVPASPPTTTYKFKVNKTYHNRMHIPRRKTIQNFF